MNGSIVGIRGTMKRSDKNSRHDDADVKAIENEMHSLTNLRIAVIDLGCHLEAIDGFHKAIGVQVPPNDTVFIFHICRGTPFLALIPTPDSKPQINEFPLNQHKTFRGKAEEIIRFISQYQESMNEVYLKRLRTLFSSYGTTADYLNQVSSYLSKIYSIKSEVVLGRCKFLPKKKVDNLVIQSGLLLGLLKQELNFHFYGEQGHVLREFGSECEEVDWFKRGDPIDSAKDVSAFVERAEITFRENLELIESWTFGTDDEDGNA